MLLFSCCFLPRLGLERSLKYHRSFLLNFSVHDSFESDVTVKYLLPRVEMIFLGFVQNTKELNRVFERPTVSHFRDSRYYRAVIRSSRHSA